MKELAMTDLELTRLCAEAMGWQRVAISTIARPGIGANPPYVYGSSHGTSIDVVYDPLHDDKQAMALLKLWPHLCLPAMVSAMFDSCNDIGVNAKPVEFNRVIVEAVANMQAGRELR